MQPNVAPSVATAFALLSVLAPTLAHAGDPCPIPFSVTEVGVVDGLDRDAVLGALASRSRWIGVSYETAKDGVGVDVTYVFPGSPAEAAGLKLRDRVATVNGAKVTTAAEIGRALDVVAPGGSATFVVARGGEELTLTVVAGRRDPVAAALTRYLASAECVELDIRVADADKRAELLTAMVDAKGRLRCADAHKAFKDLDSFPSEGDLFVLRDTTQILFSHASEASFCMKAKELDGDKLGEAAVKKVFDRLAKKYVARRHKNP